MAAEESVENYHARLLKHVKENGPVHLSDLPRLGLRKPASLPAIWKHEVARLPGLVLTQDCNWLRLAPDNATPKGA